MTTATATVTTEVTEVANLNKETFKVKLAADLGITLKLAGQIYDLNAKYTQETLDAGGRVRVPGVGVIFRDTIEAAEYRKPGTDEKVAKPARFRDKLSAKPFAQVAAE